MSVEQLKARLQKEFKAVNVMMLDEVPKLDVISTGIPSLDLATGIGGWPRRLITEVFGANQLGKSVLLYLAIAEAQKMGLIPALITTEGIPDTKWAASLGVDLSQCIVSFAHTAEDMLEQAKTLSAAPEVGILGIDSLVGSGTAREIEEDGKKQAYGISGIVAQMMHALMPNCWQTNKACLIMNQVRDEQVGTYVRLKSPGGHSLHHASSLRVYLKAGTSPKKEAVVRGTKKVIAKEIVAIVRKNKVGAPDHEATYWIYSDEPDDKTGWPGKGVDIVVPLIDTGLSLGIIESNAGQHKISALDYEQEWSNRGRGKFEDWLRMDSTRVESLYALVKEAIYEEGQGELDGDKD
jgi:recombination protein RecA